MATLIFSPFRGLGHKFVIIGFGERMKYARLRLITLFLTPRAGCTLATPYVSSALAR